MKRLFIILAAVFLLTACGAMLKVPTAEIKGDLSKYTYAYVISTSPVTSSSGVYGNQYGVYGGGTKTINPSEVISGYLMKMGYTTLPNVDPNFEDHTMVVSYGFTGRRQLSLFSYASCVMIQFRDAKTHELIATCEGEGCGDDETDDILQAINRALGQVFSSSNQ
ncbi:MAG: hypothetical protein IKP93_00160 [Paludibacteraceae bacterium]|nr:hypothetical protein [Paludibacteraceae bacterium]